MKRSTFVIYPFMVAAFPVIFLYSHNIEQVRFSQTLLPLAIMLVFTLLSLFLLKLILGNRLKAAMIVALFLVLFFSYGHIFDTIKGWMIGNFIIGRHRYLLPVWAVIFAACFYFVLNIRRDLFHFTKISNIIAFSLVAVSFINIAVYQFKTNSAWQYNTTNAKNETFDAVIPNNTSELRDIYYIILDTYASSSTLKEIYNYDNSELTNYLSERGFYIASESRSNYPATHLSLASSLNMEYINFIRHTSECYRMISNNKVIKFLKSKGYKFINFCSRYGITYRNRYADLNIYSSRTDEFLDVLSQSTMLRPFEMYLFKEDKRKQVMCTFSKLADINKIKGPKFIFAHIVCPHYPYVFGANGEAVNESILPPKENYLNQLIFVNKKVEVLVDKILANTYISPIIILQADHGPDSTFEIPFSESWKHPNKTNLKEKMRIFNAYYLPAGGSNLLYDSITPVNTFRLIFNFYFGTDYELLADRSYFSLFKDPLMLNDVTDIVANN